MLHRSPYREAARGVKNNKPGALKCSEIHKDSFFPSVLGTPVCVSDTRPSLSHHVSVGEAWRSCTFTGLPWLSEPSFSVPAGAAGCKSVCNRHAELKAST